MDMLLFSQNSENSESFSLTLLCSPPSCLELDSSLPDDDTLVFTINEHVAVHVVCQRIDVGWILILSLECNQWHIIRLKQNIIAKNIECICASWGLGVCSLFFKQKFAFSRSWIWRHLPRFVAVRVPATLSHTWRCRQSERMQKILGSVSGSACR